MIKIKLIYTCIHSEKTYTLSSCLWGFWTPSLPSFALSVDAHFLAAFWPRMHSAAVECPELQKRMMVALEKKLHKKSP